MKKAMQSLFGFTSRERNGTIVLLILIACACMIRIWMAFDLPEKDLLDNDDVLSHLKDFEDQVETQQDGYRDVSPQFIAQDLRETPELFYFDPNTATEQELLALGIEKKVTRTILNYRQNGGIFHNNDDLQKIYGLSVAAFNRLAPYIRISKPHPEHSMDPSGESHIPMQIELNMADTNDLMKLKGIGSVLSERIINYRALLGGFFSAAQLKEVYGISDSLFVRLAQYVIADSSKIKKINLNLTTGEQLSRHPYIGRYYAEGIIQYRQHVNQIIDFDELIVNNLLPEEHREHIKKYLTF